MAFQSSSPLTFWPHTRSHFLVTTARRPRVSSHRFRACQDVQPESSRASTDDNDSHSTPISRRAFLSSAAAVVIAASVLPKNVDALGLAPTPINPYARRRAERAYKEYVKAIETTIESAPVADFKKVVEAGGGGLGVSYRIAGFAAFVASACSTAIVHPIDSIKTRLQARGTPGLAADGRGLFDNLYTGIASNILKEAPNSAIYLAVYELIKSVLMNLSVTSFFHDLPLVTFLVAGALGDAIGSVVRVPAEIVNKRLQLGVSRDWQTAVRDAFINASGREGSLVAWEAVLWRDVPYGGLQIMLYEFGKQMLATHPTLLGGMLAQPGVLCDALMGALAGALAAMATTPADVLVTRLSVQNPQCYLETGQYMGVASTARRILQEEGVCGFFRGTAQRGLYYAPLIGLFFALYEVNRGVLEHPQAVIASAQALGASLASDGHHAVEALLDFLGRNLHIVSDVAWRLSEYLPLTLSFLTLRSQV